MHKLFGGKPKAPSATNLQIQKTKQIESLRKVSAIEILRDVEYRVVTRFGTTNITIVIALTAQFPQEKPIISVQPPVTHPWVENQAQFESLVTGCPGINNFSMHSDLGQAVQTVLDEFQKNPPVPLVPFAAAPPYSMMGPPPGYAPPSYTQAGSEPWPAGFGSAPPVPPRQQSGSLPNGSVEGVVLNSEGFPDFTMPNVMKAFPQLKEKKLMELQELIENDDQLLEMVQGLPELKSFAEKREALSEKCVFLARSNLAQKPVIKDMKEEIAEKMALYDEMRVSFEANCERHLALSEQFRPSNIQNNLKVAILQAEEESENITEDFLSKKMDVEDFLQQFLEKRKLTHLRRAKEEKLSHIIMSQGDQ